MLNKLLLLAISAALPLSFYGVARVATAQIQAPATASAPFPPRVLSDFGSAAEIARFERRGVDAAHFVSVPDGGAARVTFVKYGPGGMEWPALILRTNKGLLADWGDYDVLAVDVRNDGSAKLDLAFHVEDTSGNRGSRHFNARAA